MKLDAFRKPSIGAALSALLLTSPLLSPPSLAAQAVSAAPYRYPGSRPLPVDRGTSGLWQSLRKLHTRASLTMVTAHPDDEDGGTLAYLSRNLGADTNLLTLNRGESGQNVMSNNYWDELGTIRTQELLAAGNYYGVHQYWTRVTDYGFSKTIEEALQTWGKDRVLYDVIRQIRVMRPLVVNSVFVGNVSDGHGHHQTAGYMAQEAYRLAGDPNVFPEQIKEGLRPWSPLKVYGRVPFARVTEKGIYDYATGKWEPVKFKNYVDGTTIDGIPTTSVEIPVGEYNPLFGESYLELSREGLNEQKSQNGGTAIPTPRPASSPYHLYASRAAAPAAGVKEKSFFDGIDITIGGIATYAPAKEQAAWRTKLNAISASVDAATKAFDAADPAKSAPALAKGLQQTNTLLAEIEKSTLDVDAKYNMTHELKIKQTQFNTALQQSLGLALVANVTAPGGGGMRMGPMGDMSTSRETSQTVVPGQTFPVNVHLANQGSASVTVKSVELISEAGDGWKFDSSKPLTGALAAGQAGDQPMTATAPATAEITKPYYTRPSIAQSYYDINDARYQGRPTTPYPLTAQATVEYLGTPIAVTGVVQTVHRLTGPGPILEPLLVAPAISINVAPYAGIVPLTSSTFQLQVSLHSSVKGAAKGKVHLDLPQGWKSSPALSDFAMTRDGEEKKLTFTVTPESVQTKPYTITAVAEYDGKKYTEGFTTIGYGGLRPYPYYRSATYKTTGVDVKTAPGLKVGYIMGTGDDVATKLEDLGIKVTQLSPQDVATADLSQFDTIVLGIRTYAARPELRTFNQRLLDYANNGGVVVVQYQTGEYDHNYGPFPLSLSGDPEKVVEEDCKVEITAPNDPILNWPNKITTADFDGWVEERGHGFMREWDPKYVSVTEMHDAGQDPQKGGLIYARTGKGAYVYLAYAFFREMPDGVPGSFRIMANLVSLGKNPGLK